MKSALELYDRFDSPSPCSYQPMLNEFGEILLQVDDNDYQGDSRVLYRDGERYGWLQFGWGSCSGCDALQACMNQEDVQELMDSLYASIKWFDSRAEALAFFQTHDWGGDYSYTHTEQRRFVAEAQRLLAAVT